MKRKTLRGGLTAPLSFRAQLRSPQWLEKAAAVKREAGFKCELCRLPGDMVRLRAHVTFHVPELPLWRHPRSLMMCICATCLREREPLERTIHLNAAEVIRNLTNDQVRHQPIYTMFTQ